MWPHDHRPGVARYRLEPRRRPRPDEAADVRGVGPGGGDRVLPGSLPPGPAGPGFRGIALRAGAAGAGTPGRGAVGEDVCGGRHRGHGDGSPRRAGRSPPSSSTPGARFRDTRPRTSWTRARIGSTCPGIPGSSSRSTGSGSGWRSATRAGAIPRRCAGRRCGAPRSSFIPSSPAVIGKGYVRRSGARPAEPYYEKAMMMRSIENAIYFASVNYGVRFQESATSLIAPSGQCQAVLALWAGRRPGAAHRARGGHRPAGRSIRPRALSGIEPE